ncbi:hypothetical protein HPT25_23240 [Bacillus sp. BRMEA1]|nr:hypothetical protein [Neobacillus endophyticus]
MKYDKLLLGSIMLIPWLTLPFMDKRSFKRYFPSALFICVVVFIESIVAHKQKWWLFYKKLIPKTLGELPLIAGPFFVGTLWIMKFTFGHFVRYFSLNLFIDIIFSMIMTDWLRSLGLASLIRIKKYQFLFIFLIKATILYLFQFFWSNKTDKKLFRK